MRSSKERYNTQINYIGLPQLRLCLVPTLVGFSAKTKHPYK